MDRFSNGGLLGMPRSVVIALAIPGLVLFVAIFGFATHSALTEFVPWSPTWLSITLSVVGPIVALLVIGIVGALHDHEATRPMAKKLTQVTKFIVVLGMVVGLLIQLVRAL
jgi:hypothetical protein